VMHDGRALDQDGGVPEGLNGAPDDVAPIVVARNVQMDEAGRGAEFSGEVLAWRPARRRRR
jgi:hypothetical protein